MSAPVSTLLGRIALKMRSRAEKFVLRPELSVAQSRAIAYIERVEATEHRGVIQRELAEVTRTSAASVSSLIDGLEKGGYVERRSSPDDARRKELYVLPKAKGLAADFDKHVELAEQEVLSPLTAAEQRTLLELLHRLDQDDDSPAEPE